MRLSLSRMHDYLPASPSSQSRQVKVEASKHDRVGEPHRNRFRHFRRNQSRVTPDCYSETIYVGERLNSKERAALKFREQISRTLPEPIRPLFLKQPRWALANYEEELLGLSWDKSLQLVPTLERFSNVPCTRASALQDCAMCYDRASEASEGGFNEALLRKSVDYLWLAALDENGKFIAFSVALDLQRQLLRLLAFHVTGNPNASSKNVLAAPKSPEVSRLVEELGDAALHLLEEQCVGVRIRDVTVDALLMAVKQGASQRTLRRMSRRIESFLTAEERPETAVQAKLKNLRLEITKRVRG